MRVLAAVLVLAVVLLVFQAVQKRPTGAGGSTNVGPSSTTGLPGGGGGGAGPQHYS